MKNLTRLATRLFNVPLAIDSGKLEIVTQVFFHRLGLAEIAPEFTAALSAPKRDRKSYAVTEDGIAIIDVSGSLVNRSTGMDPLSGLTSYEELSAEIEDAATDPNIKASLLRFDSGGGEVGGMFELADLIAQATSIKPIRAVVDDMCCSAAYCLASQCDLIHVTRTGVTGSIGIIAQHMDQSAMDKKLGVEYTTISAGKKKGQLSNHRPLSKDAQAEVQAEVDRVYEMFVSTVARGREMSAEDVRATEAGTFYGSRGIEAGFADRIGTFKDALADLSASIAEKSEKKKPSRLAATAAAEVQADRTVIETATIEADGARIHRVETIYHTSGIAASAAAEIPKEKAPPMSEPTKTADASDPIPASPQTEKKEPEKITAGTLLVIEPNQKLASTAPVEPVFATAEQIMNLCEIADQPLAVARELMAEKLTIDQVSRKLIEKKASQQAAPTRSAVAPNTSAIDALEKTARELAGSKPGLTKEMAFADLLNASPQAYEQYLAANPAQTGVR